MSDKPLNELLSEIESDVGNEYEKHIAPHNKMLVDISRLVKELRERMAPCAECNQQIEGSQFCFICTQVAKEKSELAATRMKEELIKKVKEKRNRAHATNGIASDVGNALDELAAELEKVEIDV